VRPPSTRALRVLRLRGRPYVHAVPGGWAWECAASEHAEVLPGEVLGELVPSWAYPDAWSVALALAVRHHRLYHADGARLGLDLGLELLDAEPDRGPEPDPGGPLLPPDQEAVHHLEVCS
jgi:hypothetical protein